MKDLRCLFWLVAFVLVLGCTTSASPGAKATVEPADVNPLVRLIKEASCYRSPNGFEPRPKDTRDAGANVLAPLIWDSFVALNWPADLDAGRGVPSEPSKKGRFGANGEPLVWETWKQDWEVVPLSGGAVSPWDSYEAADPPCDIVETADRGAVVVTTENWPALYKNHGGTVLDKINLVKESDDDDDSPSFLGRPFEVAGPLIDRNQNYLRYEVRFSKSVFDCYTAGLGAGCSQSNSQISFPAGTKNQVGSITVKASWRELTVEELKPGTTEPTTNVAQEIHHRQALVPELVGQDRVCRPKTVGLMGMHIAYKNSYLGPQDNASADGVKNRWVWGTFEHRSNALACRYFQPETGFDYEHAPLAGPLPPKQSRKPVSLCRKNPIPLMNDICNSAYRDKLQSPFSTYDLVALQWLLSGVPQPRNGVANVTLEPYSQQDSCMGCHNQFAASSDFVYSLHPEDLPHELQLD